MDYYGYIYITIDHLKNKVYIGQKKGLIEKSANYYGSSRIIQAILRHRPWSLEKKILGTCNSKQELKECEEECIYFFRSYGADGMHHDNIYGYNLTTDGQTTMGFKLSEETKIKISNKSKGINNGFYGKKMPREIVERLAIKNKIPYEYIQQLAQSAEYILLMSRDEYYALGEHRIRMKCKYGIDYNPLSYAFRKGQRCNCRRDRWNKVMQKRRSI